MKSLHSGVTASRRRPVVEISFGDHRERVRAKRDALVAENLSLVPPIARRLAKTLPPSFEVDDLVQTGNIGLLRAATRFHPQTGNPFPAFARPIIRGAILDSVRRRHYSAATVVSIDVAEVAHDPRPALHVAIDRHRLIRLVGQVELSQLQRNVIDAYYSPGAPTFPEVARWLGVSLPRVWRAHVEALRTLREYFVQNPKAA